jgi:hypothetical protein
MHPWCTAMVVAVAVMYAVVLARHPVRPRWVGGHG